MDNPKDDRQPERQPDAGGAPQAQTQPPRPHGDKLDDEVGTSRSGGVGRSGDMDRPGMDPSGEVPSEQE
jgi:hypothetical protein